MGFRPFKQVSFSSHLAPIDAGHSTYHSIYPLHVSRVTSILRITRHIFYTSLHPVLTSFIHHSILFLQCPYIPSRNTPLYIIPSEQHDTFIVRITVDIYCTDWSVFFFFFFYAWVRTDAILLACFLLPFLHAFGALLYIFSALQI